MNNNEYDSIIWMGDINADFRRNSIFTNAVTEFIEEKQLVKSWEEYSIDHTHTFDKEGKTYTSTLDHIFWSENMSEQIQEADVLHLSCNLSDHSLIFCKVNIGNLTVKSIQESHDMTTKVSWKNTSNEPKRIEQQVGTNKL